MHSNHTPPHPSPLGTEEQILTWTYEASRCNPGLLLPSSLADARKREEELVVIQRRLSELMHACKCSFFSTSFKKLTYFLGCTQSHLIAWNDLDLVTILPVIPRFWDCRPVPFVLTASFAYSRVKTCSEQLAS